MIEIQTIPSAEKLKQAEMNTPHYMRPNHIPIAAIAEGFLDSATCQSLIDDCLFLPPYRFKHCNAITREIPMPLPSSFAYVEEVAKAINRMFWNFDLDETSPAAWMQTYEKGMSYPNHVDAAPGQMRKLTAVVMLTDPDEYVGGSLWIHSYSRDDMIPKTRGTIAVFPSWTPHYVSEVKSGIRRSINLGFWGPNFR